MLTHAVSPALVFPPDPPFRGAPFLKGNQPGGKPIPATPLLRRGATAQLSFFYSVAALHRERAQHLPNTAAAEHVLCLGGQHHNAALPNPQPPRSQQHSNRSTNSLLNVTVSALGAASVCNRLVPRTVADTPRKATGGKETLSPLPQAEQAELAESNSSCFCFQLPVGRHIKPDSAIGLI